MQTRRQKTSNMSLQQEQESESSELQFQIVQTYRIKKAKFSLSDREQLLFKVVYPNGKYQELLYDQVRELYPMELLAYYQESTKLKLVQNTLFEQQNQIQDQNQDKQNLKQQQETLVEDILYDYDAHVNFKGSKILIQANNLWVNQDQTKLVGPSPKAKKLFWKQMQLFKEAYPLYQVLQPQLIHTTQKQKQIKAQKAHKRTQKKEFQDCSQTQN